MKTKDMFPYSKKRIMSDLEYERVNQENQKRIEMVFSQGYTLVSMVAVFWSFTVTALGFTFEKTYVYTVSENMWQLFLIGSFMTILFAVPAFLILPFSVKYHDNLRGICSLCTYLRVFYDLPSLLGKKVRTDTDGKKYQVVTAWETIHCEVKIPNTKLFSLEYKIIAILALCLSAAMGIAILTLLSNAVFNKQNFTLKYNNIWLLLFFVLFIVLIVLEIISLTKVTKYSESDNSLAAYTQIYLQKYLRDAVDLGIITEDDYNNYCQWVGEMAERDDALRDIYLKLLNSYKKKGRNENRKKLKKEKKL